MRIATRPRRINGVFVSRTEIVPSTHHTLDHAPCTRAPCSNSGIHLLNADGDSGLAQQTSQCSHVFMRRNDRKLMMTQFYKPYSAACFQAQLVRTDAGRVICPFDVTVVIAMSTP